MGVMGFMVIGLEFQSGRFGLERGPGLRRDDTSPILIITVILHLSLDTSSASRFTPHASRFTTFSHAPVFLG
jgi:hypothetical protein